MQTIHDDMPHPVPPMAYMRYKENWFWIIIAPECGVMGMAHFNYEPLFDKARMSCNLLVKGKLYEYANHIPFPKDYAYAPEIGDGRLRVQFLEAHERFALSLDSDDLKLELSMVKRAPTFNYEAADAANPDRPSAKEIMGLATNQIFEHQQQALTISGSVQVKQGGETIDIKGWGYRDHSRAFRSDNIVQKHYWTCLQFENLVIGLMSINSIFRPGCTHNSGFIHDAKGTRAIRDFDITGEGLTSDDLPETVTLALTDVLGQKFTVKADVLNRYGYVPLVVEAPLHNDMNYVIFENFCPISLVETGDKGHALLEIGFNAKRSGH